MAFVIENGYLQRAYDVLQRAGFSSCSLGESCHDSTGNRPRFYPAPTKHLHISEDSSIRLFEKSEVLWNIPNLATAPSDATPKPDVILASDSKRLPGPDQLGRGGRFPSNLHASRIPSAWRMVEACILLLRRDRKTYGSYWMSNLCYMAEYVTSKDVLDENDLEASCKELFTALKTGSKSPYAFL